LIGGGIDSDTVSRTVLEWSYAGFNYDSNPIVFDDKTSLKIGRSSFGAVATSKVRDRQITLVNFLKNN
jgi:hypothetical protein